MLTFKHIPEDDNKSLKLETYMVVVDEKNTKEIYDKLFKEIDICQYTQHAIIDNILESYIKMYVVNDFVKFKKIIEGDIYKINIITHLGTTIDIMLTKHDKLKELIF